MAHIEVLPELVVRQIAAGECIERPASVVKELVENSLDAGATRIDIDIEEAGSQLIKISDNGCGIPQNEMALALASHATSKLKTADDLHAIRTYGFRGEALASVCAIAETSLCSATAGSEVGYRIDCKGDTMSPLRPLGMAQGTIIEVRNLFFNVPARRKFLKSKNVEMGHIADVVTNLAIAAHQVAFQLSHNKKLVFSVPATADPGERIRELLGGKLDAFWPLQVVQGDYRLEAYIQSPQSHKADNKWQYFYVNRRYVRDRIATRALEDAYKDFLPERRHPVAVLFLQMDPASVDVNVHPAKAEVRYRDGQEVYRMIHKHVQAALRQRDLTPEIPLFGDSGESAVAGEMPAADALVAVLPQMSVRTDEAVDRENAEKNEQQTQHPQPQHPQPERTTDNENCRQGMPENQSAPPAWSSHEAIPPFTSHIQPEKRHPSAAKTRTSAATMPATLFPLTADRHDERPPINFWQVHSSYIIAEVNDGIAIVDQHALHERMIYEKLRRQVDSGKIVSQPLLFAEKVRLTAGDQALLQEWKPSLLQLGLDIEPCGNNEVAVTRLPQLCAAIGGAELLQELLAQLGQRERLDVAEIIDHLLSTMACKAAVKAGDPLTREEIASLLRAQNVTDNPYHCPHGRPTVLKITLGELEKHFKRK